jgi:hypothetical protein
MTGTELTCDNKAYLHASVILKNNDYTVTGTELNYDTLPSND